VLETPLIIFPPWINRFYILDLNPKKSFIRWAVEQGLTVFMVSWKSADESLADDDARRLCARGQIDAIDTVRELLGVEASTPSAIASPARRWRRRWPARGAGRGGQGRERDLLHRAGRFSEAGDLKLFVGDEMQLIDQMSAEKGYLDGRYMAATFNLLRGRDLIWSYVTNNYLLGEDYPPFDLLHWNGDTTNLPAGWHRAYLETALPREQAGPAGGDRDRRHADRPRRR
jgi:polyhydroxyalkanoate synthase